MSHRHDPTGALIENNEERMIGVALWSVSFSSHLIQIGEKLDFAGDMEPADFAWVTSQKNLCIPQAGTVIAPPVGKKLLNTPRVVKEMLVIERDSIQIPFTRNTRSISGLEI